MQKIMFDFCNKFIYHYNTMKTVSVKTSINKLIQRFGSEQAVATRFGISVRWVIYLAKGQKKASFYLAEAIKKEAGN